MKTIMALKNRHPGRHEPESTTLYYEHITRTYTALRIVGGRLKGRVLQGPKGDGVRPTSDRLRETLSIFVHSYGDAIAGARAIDLFAGTGALGLEALSRGAEFCLFVDDGAPARALIRENIETLGLGGVTRIFRRDARRLGDRPPGAPYTLAFLDPPYDRGLAEPALTSLLRGGWLAPERAGHRRGGGGGAIRAGAGFRTA